ncbi:hypothetical protein VTN02DRAFT_3661 [Thermoascus thermophilus]
MPPPVVIDAVPTSACVCWLVSMGPDSIVSRKGVLRDFDGANLQIIYTLFCLTGITMCWAARPSITLFLQEPLTQRNGWLRALPSSRCKTRCPECNRQHGNKNTFIQEVFLLFCAYVTARANVTEPSAALDLTFQRTVANLTQQQLCLR